MSTATDREHILSEIRRTTKENGGTPLGHKRFEQVTGIGYHDWWGKHWGRWGDALRDAGFSPNTLQDAFRDEMLLIREIGRFPGLGDMRLKKRNDSAFPNEKVFDTHFGPRAEQRRAVIEYCRTHPGFDDVIPMCGPIPPANDGHKIQKLPAPVVTGFVYLMKSGKHYKIGKTNATGRREYELAIQLPEKLKTVHAIKTDDPDGIEAYWHTRFAAKRANGEWFNLDREDVEAFKRRKFM
jgi:hypothetical protein